MITFVGKVCQPFLARCAKQSLPFVRGRVLPQVGALKWFRSLTSHQIEAFHRTGTVARTCLARPKLISPAFWSACLGRHLKSPQLRLAIGLFGLVNIAACQGENELSLSSEFDERILFLLKRLGEDVSLIQRGWCNYFWAYFCGEQFVSKCREIFDLDIDSVIAEAESSYCEEKDKVLFSLTKADSVEEIEQILSNVKDPALFFCLEKGCVSCLPEEERCPKKEISDSVWQEKPCLKERAGKSWSDTRSEKGLVDDMIEVCCTKTQELKNLYAEVKTAQDLDRLFVRCKERGEMCFVSAMQRSIFSRLSSKKPPEYLYLFCNSHQESFWKLACEHVNKLCKEHPQHPAPSVFLTVVSSNFKLSSYKETLKETLGKCTAAADKLLTMTEENQPGKKCAKQMDLVKKETALLRKKIEEIETSCEQEVRNILTEGGEETTRQLFLLTELLQKTEGRRGTGSDAGQGDADLISKLHRNYLKLMLQTQEGCSALCYEGIRNYFLHRWVGEILNLMQRLIEEQP